MNKPYVVRQMPEADYHLEDCESQSAYKQALKSISHYQGSKIYNEPTDDMILGSAAHSMMLTPDLFPDQFQPSPGRKGSKIYNEAKERFPDCTFITPEKFEDLQGMRVSLKNHLYCSSILDSLVEKELSMFFDCPYTGLPAKARIDGITDNDVLIDLKTTGAGNAHPDKWPKEMINWEYHMQAAYYLQAAEICLGRKFDTFCFIVVEKKKPAYSCNHFFVPAEWITVGMDLLHEATSKVMAYREAKKEGIRYHTGYEMPEDGYQVAEMPDWYRKKMLMKGAA